LIKRHGRRVALTLALAACTPNGDEIAVAASSGCRILHPPAPLPGTLDETSGLALSRANPELLWTHNDSGGEPRLFAVGPNGDLVRTVEVARARNRDWEAISAGPCPGGHCLYVGDIGDNLASRSEVTIYRVGEPGPDVRVTASAERFRARYPGGARDAEALFVLPSGELYLISKGRTSNIALYRYPPPFRAAEVVELEHVLDLSTRPVELAEQVTSAEASPDGGWVAVLSYAALMLYRTDDLLAGRPAASVIDLSALGAPQGEAVAIQNDGRVAVTSESGGGSRASIALLHCTLGLPDPAT
jgi:hypothetical protein